MSNAAIDQAIDQAARDGRASVVVNWVSDDAIEHLAARGLKVSVEQVPTPCPDGLLGCEVLHFSTTTTISWPAAS